MGESESARQSARRLREIPQKAESIGASRREYRLHFALGLRTRARDGHLRQAESLLSVRVQENRPFRG